MKYEKQVLVRLDKEHMDMLNVLRNRVVVEYLTTRGIQVNPTNISAQIRTLIRKEYEQQKLDTESLS